MPSDLLEYLALYPYKRHCGCGHVKSSLLVEIFMDMTSNPTRQDSEELNEDAILDSCASEADTTLDSEKKMTSSINPA